uniref:Homeobox domain-containing protein n=2 Tax=Strongyloides stercoralis TaxID=6248 RepID=A0AAF5CSQ4_STRER
MPYLEGTAIRNFFDMICPSLSNFVYLRDKLNHKNSNMTMLSSQGGVHDIASTNVSFLPQDTFTTNNFYNANAPSILNDNNSKNWTNYTTQQNNTISSPNNSSTISNNTSTGMIDNNVLSNHTAMLQNHLNMNIDQFKWPVDPLYNAANFAVANSFYDNNIPYPTDPFPSTSTAQALSNYKNGDMNNCTSLTAAAWNNYQNVIIPQGNTFTGNYPWKMTNINNLKNKVIKNDSHLTHDPPYRTGPGTNNVRVRTSDKYRMVYTDFQRLELEKEYRTMQFINAERKAQLSLDLKLTERQIKIWFQNRRAKDRREKQKGHGGSSPI